MKDHPHASNGTNGSGAKGAGNGNTGAPPGGAGTGGSSSGPFSHAAPEGAAKKTSEVLGEIVWLMSQSPIHKRMFIQDLEWPVANATKS